MARTKAAPAADEQLTDVKENNAVLVPVSVSRVDTRKEDFKKLLATLSEKLPDSLIKTRKQGGAELSYLEWFTVADELDKKVGDWSSKIVRAEAVGNQFIVTVSLTVDGVTRENIGIEALDTGSYGDFGSNAFSMAFKRCAALFGIGRFLYHKDDENRSDISRPSNVSKPSSAEPSKFGKRKDGKIGATITGAKKGEKNGKPYKYLEVKVDGEKWPLKSFYNKSEDVTDLMADLNATGGFPVECFVTLKKEGRFTNVDKFFPVDNGAPNDTAPSSTEPSDEPYEGVDEDLPF